jgi:ribosomal protein S18 acetylase RimI-like enzyme
MKVLLPRKTSFSLQILLTMKPILRCVPDDAKEIEKLVNSAYRGDTSRKGWTTEADLLDGSRTDTRAIEELIKKPGTQILKYLSEGKIIGCVQLDVVDQGMYLGMLTVQPDLQGGGIGKKLLTTAEAEARMQGCKKIFMTVISVRSELIAWYERHGYIDTGKRKPFNFNDPRFGIPKQNLEFAVLEKQL